MSPSLYISMPYRVPKSFKTVKTIRWKTCHRRHRRRRCRRRRRYRRRCRHRRRRCRRVAATQRRIQTLEATKNPRTCFKKNCKNAKLWEREKKSFFAKERLLSLFCNDDEKPEKTWIYDNLNQWLPFERWTLELDVSRLAAVVSVTLIWFFK